MTMTSDRVSYLYDLMDAAYDAAAIHDQSRALGHVPIVDRNFRADHEAKAEWGGEIELTRSTGDIRVKKVFIGHDCGQIIIETG